LIMNCQELIHGNGTDLQITEGQTVSVPENIISYAGGFVMSSISDIRRCPKCKGNIFFEPDSSINYEGRPPAWQGWCLQCGYTFNLPADVVLAEELKV
jgi:predicted nucleic-acid-binding Zn-ribbon protein